MRNDIPSYVVSEDGTGAFEYELDYRDLNDRLEDARCDHVAGRLSSEAYIDLLRSATIEASSWMDGHCALGWALLGTGLLEDSLESFLSAVNLGMAAFPVKGRVKLTAYDGKNDAFLNSCYGAVLCYREMHLFKDAIAMMEKMLKWNPIDNHGIRLILGSDYLHNRKTAKAEKLFVANAFYPPYMYEMGLLQVMREDYVAAATWLRRGFLGNAYIAELLCGNSNPIPLAMSHGTNHAELELAKIYVKGYQALWRANRESILFLRWLHTHPKVMMERAEFFDCQQQLLWLAPGPERSAVLNRGETIRNNVDDRLSLEIVVRYREWRTGDWKLPWLEPVGGEVGLLFWCAGQDSNLQPAP